MIKSYEWKVINFHWPDQNMKQQKQSKTKALRCGSDCLFGDTCLAGQSIHDASFCHRWRRLLRQTSPLLIIHRWFREKSMDPSSSLLDSAADFISKSNLRHLLSTFICGWENLNDISYIILLLNSSKEREAKTVSITSKILNNACCLLQIVEVHNMSQVCKFGVFYLFAWFSHERMMYFY